MSIGSHLERLHAVWRGGQLVCKALRLALQLLPLLVAELGRRAAAAAAGRRAAPAGDADQREDRQQQACKRGAACLRGLGVRAQDVGLGKACLQLAGGHSVAFGASVRMRMLQCAYATQKGPPAPTKKVCRLMRCLRAGWAAAAQRTVTTPAHPAALPTAAPAAVDAAAPVLQAQRPGVRSPNLWPSQHWSHSEAGRGSLGRPL